MSTLAITTGLTWDEAARILTFRSGFNTSLVVASTSLLGAASGLVGSIAMLRKRSLMGDALAHAALPGLCIAFLVATWLGFAGRSMPVLLTGAAVSGVAAVACVQAMVRWTRLTEDAAIGAVLSVFFALGVVLLSAIQRMGTGAEGGLKTFILGQAAAAGTGDAILIGALALAATVVTIAMLKEFRLVCFDPAFAGAQGWPVSLVDLVLMALIVAVTVIGLQAVGLVLMVAMLIIPAAAARLWSDRLVLVVWLGAGLGALSGYVGSSLSAMLEGWPAGAVIVLTSGAVFVLSLVLAPSRGVASGLLRSGRLRWRIAQDHVMRDMYEQLELSGQPVRAGARVRLAGSPMGLWAVRATGLVRDGVLTDRGVAAAVRLTRNHRLWEEYLVTHAAVAASHVDRSADLVEHALSPEIVKALEEALKQSGRYPQPPGTVPPLPSSVHTLDPEHRT